LPPDIPVLRFPVKKDETDTYLAYLEGVKRGYRSFIIYGGLGGRADHTIANLQLLRRMAGEKNKAALISADAQMLAFSDGRLTVQTYAGQSLGVFSLSEISEGVTIEGTAYALKNGTLKNDFPLGVSNAAIGEQVHLAVKKGILLCVLSEKK
jgi:thiamine pyrophosphokinase